MPGRRPLPATDIPDFNPGCITHCNQTTLTTGFPLMYCEKDTIIDYVAFRSIAAAGATATIGLVKAASTVAVASGTAITDTADLESAADLHVEIALATDSGGRPDENLVPGQTYSGTTVTAGNWVLIVLTGTPNAWRGTLYVRFRTVVN